MYICHDEMSVVVRSSTNMTSSQVKEVVGAGFIIFRRNSSGIQYLLLQASDRNHNWSPPKGHLNIDEAEIDAAYRETKEESGFSKEQLKVYDKCKSVVEYIKDGKPKKVVLWLSELTDPSAEVKVSREHQDFKWLDFEQAVSTVQRDEMKKALNVAEKFIQDNLK